MRVNTRNVGAPSWWVWKFGGSSLATLDKIITVTKLVKEQLSQWYSEETLKEPFIVDVRHTPIAQVRQADMPWAASGNSAGRVGPNHLVVVVSAIGGVTNMLDFALKNARDLSHQAAQSIMTSQIRFKDRLRNETIKSPHAAVCSQLLESMPQAHSFGHQILDLIEVHMGMLRAMNLDEEVTIYANEFESSFFKDIMNLICALQFVALSGSYTEEQSSFVLGFGEIWSVQIIHLQSVSAVQGDEKLSHVKLVPLLLNAREVLTLSQQSKAVDVRRHLPKHTESGYFSRRSVDNGKWNDEPGFPFLPHFSRSNLSQSWVENGGMSSKCHSQTGLVDKELVNVDSLARVRSEQVACEEYAIGPISMASPTDFPSEVETSTWAFPPLSQLEKELLPPTTPPRLDPSNNNGDTVKIDWMESYRALATWFASKTKPIESELKAKEAVVYLIFITGFVGRTLEGLPTTLQRNGSDTSAVAFAALFRAEGVTIWSDVAGIYTGDPRFCANARPLEFLCYDEALELAGTGAKVLHPGALLPCIHMHLPLLLKSTFNPELQGTTIADFSHVNDEATYGKVVTTISNVVLFTLSNVPLMSLLNFASRLFAAVERGGGHPLFISQGSASSAISLAVTDKETEGVLAAVVDAFRHDTDDYGSRLKLSLDSHCSVLSVVGRGQTGFVGALASWCAALKERNVSIKAISQSSNELSTSFVVSKSSAVPALEALHQVVLSKHPAKLPLWELTTRSPNSSAVSTS